MSKELPSLSQSQINTASLGTERPLRYKGVSHHQGPASNRQRASRLAIPAHSNRKSIQEAKTRPELLCATPDYSPTTHKDSQRPVSTDVITEGTNGRVADSALFGLRETRHSFEPLIGSCEAARLLGNIHVKTVQRYARHGRVPGYQIGGHWYFRASELDAWLQLQINSGCQFVR